MTKLIHQHSRKISEYELLPVMRTHHNTQTPRHSGQENTRTHTRSILINSSLSLILFSSSSFPPVSVNMSECLSAAGKWSSKHLPETDWGLLWPRKQFVSSVSVGGFNRPLVHILPTKPPASPDVYHSHQS